MRRRLSIERIIPHLLLLIFILNLELSNALKGRWKPGDENARRFPTEKTLQNDHKNSIGTTIQNTRRIQTNGNMPNVRRYPNDRALQSVRRLPNGRTMQNFRRYPIDRALQNVRSFPIDRSPPNYGRVPVDKTLQNNRFPIDLKFPHDRFPTGRRSLQNERFPVDSKLQNDGFPIDRQLQNDRFSIDRKLQNNRFPIDIKLQNDRFPIDRKLQNDRLLTDIKLQNDGFSIDRQLQNDRFPIDGTLLNFRGISTPKTLQNAERLQIDDNNQDDSRVSVYRTFSTDPRIEYNKRLQNSTTDISDGIMLNEKRININKLFEHNRRSQDELKNKIDKLIQSENLLKDNRELDRQRPQNYRRTQNDGQAKNDLRERTRRLLDEHKEKMLHSKRMQHDKSDWAVTPHPILRQAETGGEDKPSEEFNSKEFKDKSTPQFEDQGSGWGNFWKSMTMMMENMAGLTPPGGHELITRTCYCIAATYITALHDFKKHYMWRNFYENNLQFEVGYLVAEIVSKYQRMLEIFHMATDYFFKHQNKQYAASTYVLYLYTNVLEMGTVITHLCNMLTELEDKYRFIPVAMSGFTDYHLIKVFDDTESVNLANEVLAYEKKMKKLRKEKIRQQKKLKDKSLFIGMKITTPNRRPRKGHWPYEYGWSIENNWR